MDVFLSRLLPAHGDLLRDMVTSSCLFSTSVLEKRLVEFAPSVLQVKPPTAKQLSRICELKLNARRGDAQRCLRDAILSLNDGGQSIHSRKSHTGHGLRSARERFQRLPEPDSGDWIVSGGPKSVQNRRFEIREASAGHGVLSTAGFQTAVSFCSPLRQIFLQPAGPAVVCSFSDFRTNR